MDEIKQADAMQNQPTGVTDQKKSKKNIKNPAKKIMLYVLLAVVLVGASAGAAYWMRDNSANQFEKKQSDEIASLKNIKSSLEKQLAEANGGVLPTNPTTCAPVPPSSSAIDNIKASITSGNTAALEGYIAANVTVALVSTAGNNPVSDNAIKAVTSFITSVNTSWDYDFALPAATINSYKAKFKDYFPDSAVVGKASNGKVISFIFDCNSKISTIFMANDAALLL